MSRFIANNILIFSVVLLITLFIVPFSWSEKSALSTGTVCNESIKKTSEITIDVGEDTRESLVFNPCSESNREGEKPLVIVFHGFGNKPKTLQKMTGFNKIAEENQFVVMYPEGINKGWNGRAAYENPYPRDVKFVKALINKAIDEYNVDPSRVYVAGISNGGFLVHNLACELSDKIAAFAAVASTIGKPLSEQCTPKRPVNLMMMNGTSDPVVTWEGDIERIGFLFRSSIIKSVPETTAFWQEQNNCTKSSTRIEVQDNLYYEEYGECRDNVTLQQWVMKDVGHTWPGQNWNLFKRIFFGKGAEDIHASKIIWEFFADKQLEAALT